MLSDVDLRFTVFSVGGTAGAIVTCPLEVVKTRLQVNTIRELNCHHCSILILKQPLNCALFF